MLSYKTYLFSQRQEAFDESMALREKYNTSDIKVRMLRPELNGVSESIWVIALETGNLVLLWNGDHFVDKNLVISYLQQL